MARPGLTIALLLTTPALVDACRQWLPQSRYHSIDLSGPDQEGEQLDLVGILEAQQEQIDALDAENFDADCFDDVEKDHSTSMRGI